MHTIFFPLLPHPSSAQSFTSFPPFPHIFLEAYNLLRVSRVNEGQMIFECYFYIYSLLRYLLPSDKKKREREKRKGNIPCIEAKQVNEWRLNFIWTSTLSTILSDEHMNLHSYIFFLYSLKIEVKHQAMSSNKKWMSFNGG